MSSEVGVLPVPSTHRPSVPLRQAPGSSKQVLRMGCASGWIEDGM